MNIGQCDQALELSGRSSNDDVLLWQLGENLQVPGFRIIECVRIGAEVNGICGEGMDAIYTITNPRSLYRKFAAALLACKNLFAKHAVGSPEYKN